MYYHVLKNSDKITYTSSGEYTDGCLEARNKFMVDNSDGVIAVWDEIQEGDTFHCVHTAKEQNKPVLLYSIKNNTIAEQYVYL